MEMKARFQTPKFKAKRIAKFWNWVDQSSGPSACWEWQGYRYPKPFDYGQFSFDNIRHKTHRLAWRFTFDEVPEDLFVCHHCDNPPCCNPAHLFLGADVDNVRDMHSKGRGNTGMKNGNAFIPPETITAIRASYTGKWGDQARIVRDFGVSAMHVCNILRGTTRKDG